MWTVTCVVSPRVLHLPHHNAKCSLQIAGGSAALVPGEMNCDSSQEQTERGHLRPCAARSSPLPLPRVRMFTLCSERPLEPELAAASVQLAMVQGSGMKPPSPRCCEHCLLWMLPHGAQRAPNTCTQLDSLFRQNHGCSALQLSHERKQKNLCVIAPGTRQAGEGRRV